MPKQKRSDVWQKKTDKSFEIQLFPVELTPQHCQELSFRNDESIPLLTSRTAKRIWQIYTFSWFFAVNGPVRRWNTLLGLYIFLRPPPDYFLPRSKKFWQLRQNWWRKKMDAVAKNVVKNPVFLVFALLIGVPRSV